MHAGSEGGPHVFEAFTETAVPPALAFSCGVTAMKGPRERMEDEHVIVVPFAGVHGQGLFGVFDGHGGKKAAKWCKENFPRCLMSALQQEESGDVTEALKHTFEDVDAHLEQKWAETDGKMHSGATAVVAFLRLEDENGGQSFLPPDYEPLATAVPGEDDDDGQVDDMEINSDDVATPPRNVCRVLYCANVGDARAVLCRAGKATRLTYDHTTQDSAEVQRIEEQGGTIEQGRVEGVLIPTRALGDPHLNAYVTGTPYTTEMELTQKDEFLILACDGLWDVIDDQEAVDLIRSTENAQDAAQELLDEARRRSTQDNVTVLVVRLRDPPKSLLGV
ncbi:protein serine/threonine phosphatase 2C [Trametes punicea]|nr:protein serine/threonine phosphatase 2C [Trametes punicea]